MDCKAVIKQINERPFDTGFQPDKEVLVHVESCAECCRYYEAHRESARLVSRLRNQNPVLNNPEEMKSAILSSIEKSKAHRKPEPIRFFIRFLAAASLVLLLTLGMEQYTILRKVQHLEVQLGKVKQNTPMQQMQLYQSSLVDLDVLLSDSKNNQGIKSMLFLLRMKHFVHPDLTYKELQRTIDNDKNLQKLLNDQKQKP